MNDKPTIKIYGATVDRIEVVTGPDTWAVTVDDLLALKAEVERLRLPPEPLEWVYGVWETNNPYKPFWNILIKGVWFFNGNGTLEETIEDFLSDIALGRVKGESNHPSSTTFPAFGVRLDETGNYSAYRDGKRIKGSRHTTAEKCLGWTISRIHPAVTLADLPVVEGVG